MTFAELVQETNAYQYSKEYFDLVKECAEIDTYSQWLRCQDYMSDNSAIVESVSAASGSDYFIESSNPTDIIAIQEKVAEKASKVIGFIVEKAKKLWGALCKMASFVGDKFSEMSSSSKAAVQFLTAYPEIVGTFNEEIDGIAKKFQIVVGDGTADASINRAFRKRMDVNIPNASGALIMALSDHMSLAFANASIAMSLVDLSDLMDKLLDVKTSAEMDAFERFHTSIIKKHANTHVDLDMSDKSLKKEIKRLTDVQNKLNKFETSNIKELYGGTDGDLEVIGRLNKASANIFRHVSKTIQALRNIQMFKSQALQAISTMIKAAKKEQKENGTTGSDESDFDEE